MHSAYSKCLFSTGTLQFASPTVTESGEVSHTYIIYFSLLLTQNVTFRQKVGFLRPKTGFLRLILEVWEFRPPPLILDIVLNKLF